MALAALSIDMTAKVAQFEQDLGKAARASEKVSADMRAAFGTVGAALGGLTAVLSVGFVTQLVTASIDAVDALNDVADATGASIENISALQDVAARTGTEFATVETALFKLNSVLNDATPGSKQAAILSSIGLSADELRKLDPAEAVLEVSKALAQYEDDGDKARLVQELFGKGAKDLAPLLKDLADKGKLVATVTTEQAAEAEKFNRALAGMKADMAGATRTLVSGFLPAATNVTAALSDLQVGQRALSGVGSLVATAFEAIAVTGANVAFVFEGIGREIGAIAAQTVALAKGDIAGFNAISEAVKADALEARRDLDSFEARILGLGAKTAAIKGDSAEPDKPKVGPLPKAVVKQPRATSATVDTSYQKLLEDIEKATIGATYYLETGKEISSAENFRLDLLKKINDEWTHGKLTLVEAVEAEGRMNDAYGLQLQVVREIENAKQFAANQNDNANTVEATQKQTEALSDLLNQEREQIAVLGLSKQAIADRAAAKLEEQADDKERRAAVFEDIDLTGQMSEQYREQAKALRELAAAKREGAAKEAGIDAKADAEKLSKEAADTLKSDLKGAFSAAFRDSSGDPLKAFGDALENVMFSRAATALSEAAMQGLEGLMGSMGGSSGGGVGDFVASLLSFDGGGSTGSGARSGGIDGKGGFLSILHPNETVLDHTKGQSAASAGGGISIVQHITVDSRSDASSIRAAMQQAKAETLAAIQQSRRAGGAFA